MAVCARPGLRRGTALGTAAILAAANAERQCFWTGKESVAPASRADRESVFDAAALLEKLISRT